MKKIAIFVSGTGTNMDAIITASRTGKLKCEVALVISDNPQAKAISKAEAYGIPVFSFIPKAYQTKVEFETIIVEKLQAAQIDLLILAGYMRLIGTTLLQAYPQKIINIHPSLLPKYKGKDAVEQAMAAGEKQVGVTIHYVDEGMDTGKIIAQQRVVLTGCENKQKVEELIHQVEHQLYPQTIGKLIKEEKEGQKMKKRALISVSDKTGIVAFTASLIELGYEIISTGGTQSLLEKEGLSVQNISEITGFPEIMDGRVKTLHPAVHGGLLAVRGNAEHTEQLQENQLAYIDIVVVNLYPFKETITKQGVTYEEAIENIDIGGPSMLRSAAKNHQAVTVLTDPKDYETVIAELKTTGETSYAVRQALAVKVFQKTAAYDALIADYFATEIGSTLFPEQLTVTYELQQNLRYGENPQQQAAFYRTPLATHNSLAYATQLQGKELSYNNIQDANAALEVLSEYTKPAVVALKHMNPCGVGVGEDISEAWQKAYDADPTSIFGGIIATNQIIDEQTAQAMKAIFLEVIIAPDFTPEALAIFATKKNVRLLQNPSETHNKKDNYSLTSVNGGLLVQTQDTQILTVADLEVVTRTKPTEEQLSALLFAWNVVKHVKSNAIVIAKNGQTLGIGAGQMNRVGAAKIALEQAGVQARGNVMSSDAFFPMADTVELAATAGIAAIIQPGGSIKDAESIAAADKHGIAMVFTATRHFKH